MKLDNPLSRRIRYFLQPKTSRMIDVLFLVHEVASNGMLEYDIRLENGTEGAYLPPTVFGMPAAPYGAMADLISHDILPGVAVYDLGPALTRATKAKLLVRHPDHPTYALTPRGMYVITGKRPRG